jgi:methionyl-tRNA synthetase
LEGLRWLAVLLQPVMPASAAKMADCLGLGATLGDKTLPEALEWGGLAPGTQLHKGEALFPRLE